MRPKFVILLLLAGLAGLAVIYLLKPPGKPRQLVEATIASATNVAQITEPAVVQPVPITNSPFSPAPARPVRPAPFTTQQMEGENAEYIQKQIDHLEELMMNDDDASLQAILKELTNTNAIIRHEAIEATIQFGGHTAVPVLKDLASRTWDPEEKQELLDAAEFLSLPTWSEVKAQNPGMKLPDGLAPTGQP